MTHRTGCSALRHRSQGQSRSWEHRPSDHLLGQRAWIHGPIVPMDYGRPPLRRQAAGLRPQPASRSSQSSILGAAAVVTKFKHCDDYIDDEAQPACLRAFLDHARSPAHGALRDDPRPTLFADYHGKPVRVVMASRLGDVGITEEAEERVARAIDPEHWRVIDQWERWRRTANFDDRADDLRAKSLARARAAIAALSLPVTTAEKGELLEDWIVLRGAAPRPGIERGAVEVIRNLRDAVQRADDTPGMRISILRCAIADAIAALKNTPTIADDGEEGR